MGYTHYFKRPVQLNKIKFKRFADDVQKLLRWADEHDIKIAGPDGFGKPEVTNDLVAFNGSTKDDEMSETFYVPRIFKPEFWRLSNKGFVVEFCKTSRQPYDVIVGAALIALHHHFPQIKISSDARNSDGTSPDFHQCRRVADQVLGYGLRFRLRV